LLLDGLDALAAALLAGRSPEAAVRRLDALLGLGGGRFRAATGGAAFEPAAGPLMGVVVAVARDALTFTGGSAAARIRRCPRAGPPCGRLFVDASPAGTREYCSPTCAAVERARRHRARMRA
jgi:predicted RNA-binding Zn ribbon-like protein